MSLLFNIDDVISIRHNFALGESRAFNILHYQIVSKTGALPGPTTVLVEIAEALFDLWSGPWAVLGSVDVQMEGTSAQNIWPLPRSRLATYTPGAPVAGTVAGDAMPLQDSVTLLKLSDYGQRWGLGRVFVVGLAEGSQDAGVVTNVLATAALEVLAETLDDNVTVTAGAWSMVLRPVLFHAPTPETEDEPATPVRITPVVEARVSDFVVKSMKTRRPGKGI